MQNDAEIKVLFIGLDGAGKTSIITKLKGLESGERFEIFPTAFLNCARITFNNIFNLFHIQRLIHNILFIYHKNNRNIFF